MVLYKVLRMSPTVQERVQHATPLMGTSTVLEKLEKISLETLEYFRYRWSGGFDGIANGIATSMVRLIYAEILRQNSPADHYRYLRFSLEQEMLQA